MLTYAKTPEEAGVASRGLLDFLDTLSQKGLEVHAAMVLRHGKVAGVMEFSPYTAYAPHMLFSLSKSFCSCAVGFAVAEGLLRYEDKVLDILPDKAPKNPGEWLRRLTLADLLCMGSGLDPKSDQDRHGKDWAKQVLSYNIEYEPGTHFHYNSMNTYLASCMVQRVTGMTCRDYLAPRLFDKIGIQTPDWDSCPMGVNCGGWGLHLSCEDIAKFGQLLLQHGVWEGERVLPEGWVEHATSKKIDNYNGDINNDWQQGYCQQFWRTRGGRYRGDGAYGQICMVDEQNDAVIAVTAGLNDMGAEFDAIHDHIIPALGKASDEKTQAALAARLKTLSYPFPEDDGTGRDLSGLYRSEDGHTMNIAQTGEKITMTLTDEDGATRCVFTTGKPYRGKRRAGRGTDVALTYLAQYGWQKGELRMLVRMPGSPFTGDITVAPIEGGLRKTVRGAGMDGKTRDYMKVAD